MKQECTWRRVAAGAAGGLVASFAMNQFQSLATKAEKALASDNGAQQTGGDEDAIVTAKTAQALARIFTGRNLTKEEEQWAAPAVHYGFGAAMGAVYGALAGPLPLAAAGSGTAFGAALWLAADEVAAPAFGLSGPPGDFPLSTHANALAAHLVFGVVTDLVRRGISALV